MQQLLSVIKPIGKTPLEIIYAVKKRYPALAETTISYAGRLDPMAGGLLLLLIGEENKNRHSYEAYKKTYSFQFILGVATDSYDLLGLITDSIAKIPPINTAVIKEILMSFQGNVMQPYPPYSSKPVLGKPLYAWARENKLQDIVIPEKEITIYSSRLIRVELISSKKLLTYIEEVIPRVSGSFRQEKILKKWRTFLMRKEIYFPLITAEMSCSSGTYIRGIVHEIGDKLWIPATAFSIIRTEIGPYRSQDAVKIDE